MKTDHRSVVFPATGMPDADWWHVLWPRPEQVAADVGVTGGMSVIDLCCGDGWFTVPLARISRHVVAIDVDPRMLELTRAALRAAVLSNYDVIEGDAYDIDRLVREPADFLFMANTFHGVSDKGRLARAMAAALKTNGKLAIINWHRRPREETRVLGQPRGPQSELRMEPADVAATTAPAGFELVRVVELPPYHYAAVLVKSGQAPRLTIERDAKSIMKNAPRMLWRTTR